MTFSAFTYGGSGGPGFGALLTPPRFTGVTPTGNAFPVPVAVVIQGGTVGTAYSETISAVGGASPYTFLVLSGSIPTGLSLNTSTGVISGTPTTVSTFTFTIQATDSHGITGSQAFSIDVVAAATGGSSNYGFAA